ncbi:AAA family ATPase [Paenibacillus sp. NPDC057967]|uniref:AAA family ATPase n=1 Tax=Paenibacillus sp. NPDC057967 TaxID=3346293 RepID=UPI0036D9F4A0
MSVEEALISKVIDGNEMSVFDQYDIVGEYFLTEIGRKAYEYTRSHAESNGGKAPSYAILVEAVPEFTYIPGVTDEYTFLVWKLKENWGKIEAAKVLQGRDLPEKFGEIGKSLTISDFTEWLTLVLSDIKLRTSVRKSVGIDIAEASEKFLTEYRARKDGTSFRLWPSKFTSVNKAIGGGYYSGNMYTWYARSGRGKSVLTMEEALEAAVNGATVLVWLMEMALYEYLARSYTSISARLGVMLASVDGVDYEAGFDNRAMLAGKLPEEAEAELETFIAGINEVISGKIIVRSVDDPDFRDRTLRQLEADIREVNADVVVIDPIYYMDYEANTSKTAGGDVAATSKGLRRLAGSTGAVIHVITQAEENAAEKEDDGARELKPPKRAEIKKTKAVLEDATNVFGIDTLAHEGRGVIEIGKGRSGGEDTRIEIVYLPNYGIVREPVTEDVAAKFVGNF